MKSVDHEIFTGENGIQGNMMSKHPGVEELGSRALFALMATSVWYPTEAWRHG